jgi:peptide/nickel transport system substrate-binding protein
VSADGQTLTIGLTRPYPPLWDILADVRAAVVRETADGLIGTGPYVRKPSSGSDASGATIVLTANPDYRWAPAFYRSRGPARVGTVVLRSYGQEADLAAAVTAGEVDIAPGAGLTAPASWQVVSARGQAVIYLGFNTTRAPLNDARVRRAVAVLAREGISAKASTVSPDARLAAGYLPGGTWGASADVPSGDAVALLTEPGYAPGADGTRVKDGQPLRLTIDTPRREAEQSVGNVVWEALTASGIGVELSSGGAAGAATGEAFIGRYAWNQPDVLFYLFHSGAAANRFGYADGEQDSLLRQQPARWT